MVQHPQRDGQRGWQLNEWQREPVGIRGCSARSTRPTSSSCRRPTAAPPRRAPRRRTGGQRRAEREIDELDRRRVQLCARRATHPTPHDARRHVPHAPHRPPPRAPAIATGLSAAPRCTRRSRGRRAPSARPSHAPAADELVDELGEIDRAMSRGRAAGRRQPPCLRVAVAAARAARQSAAAGKGNVWGRVAPPACPQGLVLVHDPE